MNYYADIDYDLEKILHGAARMQVHLARMDNEDISTRGWTYNELVDGIIKMNCEKDKFIRQMRAMDTLFDTLTGIIEIGPNAVKYLHELHALGEYISE